MKIWVWDRGMRMTMVLIVSLCLLFLSVGYAAISTGYKDSASDTGYRLNMVESVLFVLYTGATLSLPFILMGIAVWLVYTGRKTISLKRSVAAAFISFYILSLAYNGLSDYFYRGSRESEIENFQGTTPVEQLIRDELLETRTSVFSLIPLYSSALAVEEEEYIDTVARYIGASRFWTGECDGEITAYLGDIQGEAKRRLAKRMISWYEESPDPLFGNVVVLLATEDLPIRSPPQSILPLYVISLSILIAAWVSPEH